MRKSLASAQSDSNGQDSPISEGPAVIDARRFMNATPDNDDILAVLPVQFLKGVKNPCFALTNKTENVGNIDILTAISKGYEIRCLPYFYIAG